MMMFLRMLRSASLLVLLIISGVCDAQDGWGVTYTPNYICALKGSTVTLSCTYTYPPDHTVQTVFWTKGEVASGKEHSDLASDPEYRGRVQYGDNNDCTLTLSSITEKDQRKYYFRFITDQPGGRYLGRDGVQLHITGIQVEVPETVKEGAAVTLRCKTNCTLTDNPTFTWYRNQQQLQSTTSELRLQPVRMEDGGRYQCAVGDHRSSAVTLNVGCLQLEVPETVKEGAAVTLTCKTCRLANTPTFTWYRNEQQQKTTTYKNYYTYHSYPYYSYTSELHLQSVRMEDGGRYQCGVGDRRSSAVTLNVECLQVEGPENVSEGSDVTLRCKIICTLTNNPTITWYKDQQPLQTTDTSDLHLRSVRMEDGGRYQCAVGDHRSSAVTLIVGYPPKRVLVFISPASEIIEGSSVILTCSSDAKPAAWYQWFKGTTNKATGKTLTIHKIRSDDGGEYKCLARNEHGDQDSTAVIIDVHCLQVEVPETVKEGTAVTLRCKTICRLTDNPTFTWYRNQQLQTTDTSDLHLQSVRMEDGGRYQCAVGDHRSSAVTLNVGYPPKRVSVSVSPSGEIMEGSSVNLTCSSDAKPAASYQWYKGTVHNATGQTFTIYKIRSDESGDYKCRARNEHGDQESSIVDIDVHYPPKNVSVSVSPSGEIMEGSSVNLTCSSDAKPAASYQWYKGTNHKATGETFTIHEIRSDDGGEYKCRARNEHGDQNSTAVNIDVHYPPRSVSVSVSPSGEIMEGSSVTLTCSSDAKPAASYHWFKGTEHKATGETFTIPEISSDDGGEYKCRARNEHGDQYSTAVNIDVHWTPGAALYAVGGVIAGCLLAIIIIIVLIRRKKRADQANDADLNQENLYSTVAATGTENDLSDPEESSQDEVQYITVVHRSRNDPAKASGSEGTEEEAQYAAIKPRRDRRAEQSQQEENQYDNVRFTRRPPTSTEEDLSVIYSSVK